VADVPHPELAPIVPAMGLQGLHGADRDQAMVTMLLDLALLGLAQRAMVTSAVESPLII